MKLSVYINKRTDHTYEVNRKGSRYMIVERDALGKVFQIMAFYNKLENAQDVLDRLSGAMEWTFCGEQKEVGFVD